VLAVLGAFLLHCRDVVVSTRSSGLAIGLALSWLLVSSRETGAEVKQLIVTVLALRVRRCLNQLGEGHVNARTASGDRDVASGLLHRLRDAADSVGAA